MDVSPIQDVPVLMLYVPLTAYRFRLHARINCVALKAKLQREDNVELESYRTQQIEMRRKVDRLSKQAEEQTRKNEKYEIEVMNNALKLLNR